MLLSHYTFKVVFPQYHCNQLYERDSYFVNLIVSRIVLNIGGFSWPRTKEEAMEITPEQFQMLMQGLSIVAKYPIKELKDPPKTM